MATFKKGFLDYVKSRHSEKTHHNYSIALGHLERYLREKKGIKSLQDVDMGMIEGYVSFRLKSASPRGKEKTVERSTVNTEFKAIKRFFNRAIELNHLRDSPARKVKLLTTAKRRPRFFSESEVALILEDCRDSWVRKIYLALLYTGMRIGELVNLEWEDIEFERRRIVIRPKQFWKPKGKEERFVPMHDVVFSMLLNSERKVPWVFTKADGRKVNIHFARNQVQKTVNQTGTPRRHPPYVEAYLRQLFNDAVGEHKGGPEASRPQVDKDHPDIFPPVRTSSPLRRSPVARSKFGHKLGHKGHFAGSCDGASR